MAKDIYFNDKKNGSAYTKQNSSWNSDEFKEKLIENGVASSNGGKQSAGRRGGSPVRKKKKRGKAKTALCVIAAAIVAFAVITAFGAAFLLGSYEPSVLESNAYVTSDMLKSESAVKNILLMGVDNTDLNSDSRSDSMILLSVDTLHMKLKLTSFMRDMFVEVPGYGKTKLTHACQYGGAQLTVDTIEMNFGIKIDAYAKIGYEFLADLVDGLGGITVPEIDKTESAALYREGARIDPGEHIKLNGKEAVAYCRIRKGQSDFQRTERQRETITLIVKKALRTNPLRLLKIASDVISEMDCSIPKSDVLPLAVKMLPCLFSEIKQQQIPAEGEWWNDTVSGMAVLQIDLEANKSILDAFIYG